MVEKTAKLDRAKISGGRNYQLDFLKLIFTFTVILSHTVGFINENTNTWFIPTAFAGWTSVHFFFIVSGLLMVNSYMNKQNINDTAAGASFNFVIRKFKAISIEYWIALLIAIVVIIVVDIGRIDIFQTIICSVSEIFVLEGSGLTFRGSVGLNGPTWYISSMLISMLFLYYILCKNKDFFLYIFSPIAALLLYSYMYKQENNVINWYDFYGVLSGGLIRAVCGICFGSISYIIFSKVSTLCKTNRHRILLTVIEILLYTLFFAAWYNEKTTSRTMYAAMLLLPIIIAIAFSGKSYISKLFKIRSFKYLSSISLAIYLNHWAAIRIVNKLFPGESYKKSFTLMMGITALLCVVYYTLVYMIKKIIYKMRLNNDTKI